jgi:prepilin-type N-terminal cleavage/methylation domain-containing protein
MKTYEKTKRAAGFTLIELLVVITIIAALAALSFAGVNAALKRARTTEAEVMANGLVTAVERFETEYNRLPDFDTEVETSVGGQGAELLRVLLAQEGTGTDIQNKRKIVFLEAKEAKGRRGGIYYGSDGAGATAQGMFDPFGNPFTVVMNTDYEDTLTFQYGNQTYNLRGKSVVVYSPGADRVEGNQDDILTFQR